ncbi:MAG: DUF4347 domain-containing protein [Microcoleus sp. SU_5_3]|nr:DUF4347 domain-containing protein [Microcoleus sp. SU_5_3]
MRLLAENIKFCLSSNELREPKPPIDRKIKSIELSPSPTSNNRLHPKNTREKHIVFIDSRVENWQQLASGIKPGTEAILLDPTGDGISQITKTLAKRSGLDSIQIVAHGKPASLQIGTAKLDSNSIENYSSQLQQWQKSLIKNGDILLVACSLAAGEIGKTFVQQLRKITGANIAASANLTGSAAKGGDWELEVVAGEVTACLAFQQTALETYNFVLGTLVNETFSNATVLGPWTYSGANRTVFDPSSPFPAAQQSIPGITAGTLSGVFPGLGGDLVGSGVLRLTTDNPGQQAFVLYNNTIPSTDGLRITFDFFAYGGTDAQPGDGISFFLIDGTASSIEPGGFGGSLGYANNSFLESPGLVGGYLGIGLDEFGNFSNPTEGRIGGPGQVPDAVTIRGGQVTRYQFLTNAVVPGGIDNPIISDRALARKRIQIILDPPTSPTTPNRLTVALDLNNNDLFTDPGETLINIPNLATANGSDTC